MALFKPKGSSSGGNKFTGICELGIVGFIDKSADFDWADIFIEAEVKIKESEYTRTIKIKGSLEKDNKRKVSGGSVLNRLYKFFADIGCTAGINTKGEWQDDSGNPIVEPTTTEKKKEKEKKKPAEGRRRDPKEKEKVVEMPNPDVKPTGYGLDR